MSADRQRQERGKAIERYLIHSLATSVRINRLGRGWTQAALARRAGTTQEQISRIEQGRGLPNLRSLERIAQAFDCALIVRFCAWSELVIPPFDSDEQPRFQEPTE